MLLDPSDINITNGTDGYLPGLFSLGIFGGASGTGTIYLEHQLTVSSAVIRM